MSERSPIPKRFRPFNPAAGPWLIWSYYHNCWHRRSDEGGAAGYTNDIERAGVFEERTARAYHDAGPRQYRRDVSIPAHKVVGMLKHAADKKRAEADAIEATIARILPTSSEPDDGAERVHEGPAHADQTSLTNKRKK